MERCGIDNLCASTPFLRLRTRFAATVYNFVAPHLRESAGAGHVSTHTYFNVLYLKLCPLSAFGDDRRTTEYIRHRTAREALEKPATNQIHSLLPPTPRLISRSHASSSVRDPPPPLDSRSLANDHMSCFTPSSGWKFIPIAKPRDLQRDLEYNHYNHSLFCHWVAAKGYSRCGFISRSSVA